jgi:lipoprotein-anchoring transpeptidase ErfK/SrfK
LIPDERNKAFARRFIPSAGATSADRAWEIVMKAILFAGAALSVFFAPGGMTFAQTVPTAPSAATAPATPAVLPAADVINAATLTTKAKAGAYNPTLAKAQILLDRAHFSPGVIDGLSGANVRRAVAAYAKANGLTSNGTLNEAVWTALTASSAPAITTYTISAADVSGPFVASIPTGNITAMSKLASLSFTSPREALAEKFHMTEGLLKALNPRADFTKAGTQILVASVASTPLAGEVASIEVNKSTNSVSAFDAQNKLLAYFPATVGSSDRPAPSGTWAVQSIAFDPTYYYDPGRLTFGEGVAVGKLKVAAGPNNPVGSVWIDLTKDTYGIHGGPDPQKIGKVSSHGCVRLTNWDAITLGKASKAGVKVVFVGDAKA